MSTGQWSAAAPAPRQGDPPGGNRRAPRVPAIKPSGGSVYVVRWTRPDGREMRQRFYRRGTDAARFAACVRMFCGGCQPRVYVTAVDWQEVVS
jgi:hypothetical protein